MKMHTATVEQMRQHVKELADAFKIYLFLEEELPPHVACAIRHPDGIQKGVVAKTVTDETSYAVVLHEMGHLLAPLGQLRMGLTEPGPYAHPRERHAWVNLMLEEEAAAWDWAHRHALCWTIAMEMVEQQAYGTYRLRKARTR